MPAADNADSVHSFDPISAANARILILGSMPGKASLLAGQYYAYPRNAYWRIMESIFGIGSDLPYQERCTQLRNCGIALWDVLKICTRTGSLDSDIVESSIITNDFEGFLSFHTEIEAIYFNGAKAEKSFVRYVVPSLPDAMAAISRVRLPSTSPANASLRFEQKLSQWKQIRDD